MCTFIWNNITYTIIRKNCDSVLYTDNTHLYLLWNQTLEVTKCEGNSLIHEYKLAKIYKPCIFIAHPDIITIINNATYQNNTDTAIGKYYKREHYKREHIYLKILELRSISAYNAVMVSLDSKYIMEHSIQITYLDNLKEVTEEEFVKKWKEVIDIISFNAEIPIN